MIPLVSMRGNTASSKYIKNASYKNLKEDLKTINKKSLQIIFGNQYEKGIPNKIYKLSLLYTKKGIIKQPVKFINYYKSLISPDHYIPNQFIVFSKFCENNYPKCLGSDEFYEAKYGKFGKYYKTKVYKERNPYSIVETAKRKGVSISTARKLVKEHKAKTSGTLENFIRRANGNVKLGTKRYKIFCKKSAHTEETFKIKFGTNYKEHWDSYRRSKNSYDLDYYIKRYGEKLGKRKLRKRYKASIVNYEKYVEIYGEKQADAKYFDYCKRKTKYWREQGYGSATKESMKMFSPICRKLDKAGIKYKIGLENNAELALFDRDSKKPYFYDFCVPDIKLIIEFDGASHPHPKLTTKELENWRCFYSGVSGIERRKADKRKAFVAKQSGYKFIRVHYLDFKKRPKILTKRAYNIIRVAVREQGILK